MLLDCDFKVYGIIDERLIRVLEKLCQATDWSSNEYNRFDNNLTNGKLITLPYLIGKKEAVNSDERQKIIDASLPICDRVLSMFPDHRIVRGEVATIPPGTSLTVHEDGFNFHKKSKRIHIPIITNDGCKQMIDKRFYHFERGVVYELNNRIKHSAINFGKTYRTHLILDLLSYDEIPEGITDDDLHKILTKPVILPINRKEVDDSHFPQDPEVGQVYFDFGIEWRWRGDRWV